MDQSELLRIEEPAQPGTLRGLGAALLSLLRTRVALLGVEVREEAERGKRLLALGAAGYLFLNAAILLAAAFVVVAFWDTYRLLALGGVTLVYAAIAFWLLRSASQALRDAPPPFSASVKELERDLAMLKERHG